MYYYRFSFRANGNAKTDREALMLELLIDPKVENDYVIFDRVVCVTESENEEFQARIVWDYLKRIDGFIGTAGSDLIGTEETVKLTCEPERVMRYNEIK